MKTKSNMTVKQKHCETCQQFGKGTCNAFKCIARNYCDWEEIKRPKPMQNTSNMGKPKELDWVEPLWDIIGEVKIPSTLKGHDELSLFDVCMRGNEDEEGIWLAKKLEKFIQSLLTQQRTELLEEIEAIVEEQLFWYEGEDYGSITAREALNQVKNLLNKKDAK